LSPADGSPPEPDARADALFAASQLGQRLHTVHDTLLALSSRRAEAWTPPESPLRLTDRTI
jgi:hypothetical protein